MNDAPNATEPLSDHLLGQLRILLDCGDRTIKAGTVRALLVRLERAEGERKRLGQTIAAFPDANNAANIAHARAQRDALAAEIERAHEAVDLAVKRAQAAEAEHGQARRSLDSVRVLADAIARLAKFGLEANPGVESWAVLDFHARHLVAALAPAQPPAAVADPLEATLAPHLVVTSHGGLHWHVTHPAPCHRLQYGEGCLFDLARELGGFEMEPPQDRRFVGTPYVAHDHGDGECERRDCPVLIRWSPMESPESPSDGLSGSGRLPVPDRASTAPQPLPLDAHEAAKAGGE